MHTHLTSTETATCESLYVCVCVCPAHTMYRNVIDVVFPGIIDAMEAAGARTAAYEGPGDEATPTSPVTSAPVAAEPAAYPAAHVVSSVVAMPSFAVGTEVTQRFHGFCEMDGKVTRVWAEPDGQQMHHVQYEYNFYHAR